jgi:hypothetical protein
MKLKELRGVSPTLVGRAEFKDLVIIAYEPMRAELGMVSVRNGLKPTHSYKLGDAFST